MHSTNPLYHTFSRRKHFRPFLPNSSCLSLQFYISVCYAYMMKLQKKPKHPGYLTTNNVIIEPHEHKTIDVLLSYGYDIEILLKSHTPHTKSADIFMCRLIWEMKSPTGKTTRSIDRILHRAVHQSRNIIIDTRRTKIPDSELILLLKKLFHEIKSIRKLWIITKQKEIIKLQK